MGYLTAKFVSLNLLVLLLLGTASPCSCARYLVLKYADPPPYQGWPGYEEVIQSLIGLDDDPDLDEISDDVFALFHGTSTSFGSPGVQEMIVFAWLDGERVLLADERGYASLGTLGEARWENGWYDFAGLASFGRRRDDGQPPEVLATAWVRVENGTGKTLLLLDDVGTAAVSPEEGGRLLAEVPPGSSIERPVLRRRSPWLVLASGPKVRLNLEVSEARETLTHGVRISILRKRLAGLGEPPRWEFVIRVEDAEERRLRVILSVAVCVLAGWVAWIWWRGRRRSVQGE